MSHLGGIPFLYFGSLLHLSTVITFEASMLGPKKGGEQESESGRGKRQRREKNGGA